MRKKRSVASAPRRLRPSTFHTRRLRRTTRTLVADLPRDVGGHAGWRRVSTTPLDLEIREDWMSVPRPRSAACIAGNDAPHLRTRRNAQASVLSVIIIDNQGLV
jgi:hypothetical protein